MGINLGKKTPSYATEEFFTVKEYFPKILQNFRKIIWVDTEICKCLVLKPNLVKIDPSTLLRSFLQKAAPTLQI